MASFRKSTLKALDFYTDKLRFEVKNGVPRGHNRWLTVVSKEQLNGTELLLEEAMEADPVRMAVLDDTCGNLIQQVQMTGGLR